VKSFKEKIELIKDMKNTFSKYSISINDHSLLESLSADEVLDDMFELEFVPLLQDNNWYSNINKPKDEHELFVYIMQDSRMSRFMKKIDSDSKEKVYDKLIKKMIKLKKSIIGERIHLSESNNEYIKFLLKIIDNNLLYLFRDNFSFIKSAADYCMTYETLDSINIIKNAFDKDSVICDLYVGYPLVIINKNLNKEEKIEIIKSTYRQKDLNKYTSFIRENLSDMGDLDDFIEATIMQNNRVSKKEEGFIELIRRIFIGLQGDNNFNVDKKLDNVVGIEDFAEKYRDYFTTDVIKDLTSKAKYSSHHNIVRLITKLFKNQSFEYKMKVSIGCSDIGERLFQNLSEIPKDIIGNEKLERLYFHYILNTSSNLRQLMDKNSDMVIEYANKFPDLFSEPFTNAFGVERNNSWNKRAVIEDNMENVVKFLSGLNCENINKFEIMNMKRYFNKFGLTTELTNWRAHEDLSLDFKKFFVVWPNILSATIEKNDALKKYIRDKYYIKFEDADFMNDSVTFISSILNNNSLGKNILIYSNYNTMSSFLISLFTSLINFIKKLDDSNGMVAGLEQARDELLIICTL
jgi:hypothetical protein